MYIFFFQESCLVLYLLQYSVIQYFNLQIHDEETWKQILLDFKMPKGCCNGSQALKHVYVR